MPQPDLIQLDSNLGQFYISNHATNASCPQHIGALYSCERCFPSRQVGKDNKLCGKFRLIVPFIEASPLDNIFINSLSTNNMVPLWGCRWWIRFLRNSETHAFNMRNKRLSLTVTFCRRLSRIRSQGAASMGTIAEQVLAAASTGDVEAMRRHATAGANINGKDKVRCCRWQRTRDLDLFMFLERPYRVLVRFSRSTS